VKEERIVGSPYIGRFLLPTSLRRQQGLSMQIALLTAAIPFSYTSYVLERFEGAAYTYGGELEWLFVMSA
jgi:hypothetical protein